MFKTYKNFRSTDVTSEILRLTKQIYKILPPEYAIFNIERIPPADDEDHLDELLRELLVVEQDILAATAGQGKKITLIIDYDYSNIPSLSRAYFNKDEVLQSIMALSDSFQEVMLYAEHQSQAMTSTLAAVAHFMPKAASFYRTRDEALNAAANILGTK